MLLKNKLRTNKGLPEENFPEKPELLNLYDDYGGADVSVINSLIKKVINFFFKGFLLLSLGECNCF